MFMPDCCSYLYP